MTDRDPDFTPTDDVLSDADLHAFLHGDDPDMEPETEDVIPVCAGEWRREGVAWRFWVNPLCEEGAGD